MSAYDVPPIPPPSRVPPETDKLRVLAIGGYRGAGKDTFADALKREATARGGRVEVVAFAGALREAAEKAYRVHEISFRDVRLKDVEHPDWPGVTPREMLRRIGEGLRAYDPDHWSKVWREIALSALDLDFFARVGSYGAKKPTPFVLVLAPDVRRPNEIAYVRSIGGQVAVVLRPGRRFDGHVTEEFARDYEAGLPEARALVAYEVRNNGSVEDLDAKARTLLDDLLSKPGLPRTAPTGAA